jgi:plastocyanin
MRSHDRLLAVTLLLLALPVASDAPRAATSDHCASRVTIEAVPDQPGAFRFTTATTSRVVPPAPRRTALTGGPTQIILALSQTFDADHNAATIRDTTYVAPGTNVRWQWVAGFHTITSGTETGTGNELFDYLLTEEHPVFDTTLSTIGQLDYFCQAHEGIMHGVIRVVSGTGVPNEGSPAATSFARHPAPNPSRGTVSFAIRLAARERVDVDVVDVVGRRVSRIHRGELDAGEHELRWSGRDAAGRQVPAGVYAVRLRAAGVDESRRFSLVR